jgi:hypothetical protein
MKWDISLKITDWNSIFSKRSFWICYNRLYNLPDEWEEQGLILKPWQEAFKDEVENAMYDMMEVYTSPDGFDNEDIEEIFQANTILLEFPCHYTLEIAFWEGEHYTLFHPDFLEGTELGRDDRHPILPVFRQDELAVIKKSLIDYGKLPFEEKYIHLLINKLAFITADSNYEEALKEKEYAWYEIDLFTDEEIASFLETSKKFEAINWEHDHWTLGTGLDLGWLCNGKHCLRSARNPETSKTAKIVTNFFNAILLDLSEKLKNKK